MPPVLSTQINPTPTLKPTGYDLAVIILNWNAAADTLACVARLAAWRSVQARVWVVDNASTGDEAQHLRDQLPMRHPACTLLVNEANLGFAGGSNVGLAAALTDGDAPILLLNNDATVAETDVARLLATLDEQPRALMVGPLLYHGVKLLNAGHRDLARHVHTGISVPAATPVTAVDYVSGSVALLRAPLLREIGLLDEAYFFSGEVADLCRRGRAAGTVTLVDRRARAEHDVVRSAALRNTLYTYYLVRNRLRYVAKFEPRWRWGWWAVYTLLLAVKLRSRGDRAGATAVQLALGDAWAGRWGGQNARVLAACGRSSVPASDAA